MVRRRCMNICQNSKMYLLWNFRIAREPGLQLWKGEIIRFKEYLEQKFGVTITEEQIREAVKTENQARRSLKKLL